MKIREIYTVIREYTHHENDLMDDIKSHYLFVSDETGEFLYGGGGGEEELSVEFQIDDGTGWKDFNPEE